MALTKVAPAGIGSTPGDGYRIGSSFLHSTGAEITNVNATGIVTAANVSAGSSVTATTLYGSGANLTSIPAGQLTGTVATARLGSGTANNSSFLRGDQTWAAVTSTTINNNANDRLITGSGTANTLNAESALTFDGNIFTVTQSAANINIVSHAMGSGKGSQIKIHNDHGEAYVGTAGDTTGNLLIHNTSNTHMLFATNNTERLRITSAGTAQFKGNIEVDTGSAGMIDFGDITSAYGRLYADSTGTFIGSKSNHPLILRTNNTEKLRIDSGGRVGIKNASPSSQYFNNLVVGDNSSGDWGITIRTNSSNKGVLAFSDSDASDANRYDGYIAYHHNGQSMRFHTGGANERLRILSNGKVVVGDTNSDAQFGVYRASYNLAEFTNTNADATGAEIYLRKDSSSPADNDSLGLINFVGDNDAGEKITYAYIQSKSTDVSDSTEDGDLYFHTRGAGTLTERLRITSNGTVIAGATSVSGGNRSQYSILAAVSNNTSATGHGLFTIQAGSNSSSGNEVAQLCFSDPQGDYAWIQAFADAATGSTDKPGRLVFSTTADGATVPTERLRIDSKGQISLRGTSTAYNGTGALDALQLYYETDSGQASIGPYSSGGSTYLSFYTNSGGGAASEKLRITSDGQFNFTTNKSSGYIAKFTQSHADNVAEIWINSPADNNLRPAYIQLQNAGTNKWGIGQVYQSTSSGAFHIAAGGHSQANSKFTITTGGRILYGNHKNDRGAELQYEGDQHSCIGVHRNTNNHGAPAFHFSASRGTTAGSNTIVQSGDYLGLISFKGADGSDLASGAQITGIVDGTPGSNDMPARLGFWTSPDGTQSPKERFRIDNAGRALLTTAENFNLHSNHAALHINTPTDGGQGGLYVRCLGQSGGTASPHYGIKIDAINAANNASIQYGLQVDLNQQLIQSGTGVYADVQGNYSNTKCFDAHLNKALGAYTNGYSYFSNIVTSSSGGTAYHAYFQDNGTLKFRIYLNGNAQNANNSWGSTSDVKLKENIVDASSQWADIKAIKVRNFNFKASTGQDTSKHIGVIAQEVETVSPGLVHTDNDITVDEATGEGTVTGTTKSVKYSILYMKAIKALQEAMTRIETLEAKVTALESS